MTFDEFLDKCTPSGNITRMLMSGVRAAFPTVWEQMPDRDYEYSELQFIVGNLCTDTAHRRYNLGMGGRVLEWYNGKLTDRPATAEETAMSPRRFEELYNAN